MIPLQYGWMFLGCLYVATNSAACHSNYISFSVSSVCAAVIATSFTPIALTKIFRLFGISIVQLYNYADVSLLHGCLLWRYTDSYLKDILEEGLVGHQDRGLLQHVYELGSYGLRIEGTVFLRHL